MNPRDGLAVLLLVPPLLAVWPAAATTISNTGTPGTAGVAGADGNPGADGGTGGDGQDITLIADAPGEDNHVTAVGGAGGPGGNGGRGVSDGADGGDGGAGGNGGDAVARAIGTGASSVTAEAAGGSGGSGGYGGFATSGGTFGNEGALGASGNTLAEAYLDTDQAALATASAAAGASPFSGFGSLATGLTTNAIADVANAGGAATSTATATEQGFGTGETTATAVATAVAGAAGAATATAWAIDFNGAPTATARATADQGAVTVLARATTGTGGTADAYGANAGPAAVNVRAFVEKSIASTADGDGPARAEGHSSGGGDVNVAADFHVQYFNGGPLDASLRDAVSGSTSGLLTLRQSVTFASSSLPLFASGGDALNSLVATNPGGGDLAMTVIAQGGYEGDAVLGDVVGTSTTGADVTIDVRAVAGALGGGILQENRSGGAPSPSRIHGESNGGAITTTATFTASDGFAQPFIDGPNPPDHPDGFSVDMQDVATGDTTGALALAQSATGGWASGRPGFHGSGGSARSSLTKETASSSLELRSNATGGTAAGGFPFDPAGGDATAIVDGSNSAGSVQVFAKAVAGRGSGGGKGGDASAEATAATTGDGHDVVVGADLPTGRILPTTPIVMAGNAGSCGFNCPADSVVGTGGRATSRSIGTAAGDSRVTVFDNAIGGRGGDVIAATGGVGGAASSFAGAFGGGASAVAAKSVARAGAGGVAAESGRGGDADATAIANGLGDAEAWASATGGDSWSSSAGGGARGGSAIALAAAEGASGFARAEAITGYGDEPRLRAQSEAQVGSRRDVAAVATHGAALASAPSDSMIEGSAFFTGAPLAEDVAAARAGNAALEGTGVLALGSWTGNAGADPLVLDTDIELTMNTTDSASRLLLAAFDVSVLGDAFESLSLSLTKNGFAQRSVLSFGTAGEVLAFLTDQALELGVGWNEGDTFGAHFHLELGSGSRFGMGIGYATAVPEPSTALLIALGLLIFAQFQRRAAFSA